MWFSPSSKSTAYRDRFWRHIRVPLPGCRNSANFNTLLSLIGRIGPGLRSAQASRPVRPICNLARNPENDWKEDNEGGPGDPPEESDR
jgi:hypothetical protein